MPIMQILALGLLIASVVIAVIRREVSASLFAFWSIAVSVLGIVI